MNDAPYIIISIIWIPLKQFFITIIIMYIMYYFCGRVLSAPEVGAILDNWSKKVQKTTDWVLNLRKTRPTVVRNKDKLASTMSILHHQ